MANLSALAQSLERWKPASALHLIREEPKFSSLELPLAKKLISRGLSRGIIVEIQGCRSSGRTSFILHILAQATTRGEVCAVIDTHDSFHPSSACQAGVVLERLVWVRCRGNAEHAIRATDLLLHAGGFGVVLLDLCETAPRLLNRVPLSYWHRFRRAVEHTPAILLVCGETRQVKSCAFTNLELTPKRFHWSGKVPFSLLRGLKTGAVLRERSRLENASLFISSTT